MNNDRRKGSSVALPLLYQEVEPGEQMNAFRNSLSVKIVYNLLALFVIGARPAYGETAMPPVLPSVSPQDISQKVSQLTEVSKLVEEMRRQNRLSAEAEVKGLISPRTVVKPKDLRQLFDGGPGMDGGGGNTVVTADGRLRFLDLAVNERETLKTFDKDTYLDLMTKNGNYVSNVSTLVPADQFFSCAAKMLGRQDNELLKYLQPKNLNLLVVLTNMPLSQSEPNLSKVVFASPTDPNYPYEVTQLPWESLTSLTLPLNLQRPVASYAARSVDLGWFSRQTLIVSAQLYNKLPPRDRCALQIHELFRYISNFGVWDTSVWSLLTRSLSTQEIEAMTVKVLDGQPVFLSELPATDFYKGLAIANKGSYKNLYHQDMDFIKQVQSLLVSNGLAMDDEGPRSFARSVEMLQSAQPEDRTLIEIVMSETAPQDLTPHGQARLRYQLEKLKGSVSDLRKLIRN